MDQLKTKLLPKVYDSLINANIRSLHFVLSHSKCELAERAKLDLNNAEIVLKESACIMYNNRIHLASEIKAWQRVRTGCSCIDRIMKGGIALRGITEIVGNSGVGKTQLCLQLSLTTQLSKNLGGLEKGVVYICTEDIFPIKRLTQLANFAAAKYNLSSNFQDNIFIEHVSDFIQLKRCLRVNLSRLLNVKPIGLVVIDSIAGVFRSENFDVNYSNRSQDFVLLVNELNKLSLKHELAVVCVNQVSDNLSTGVTEPCLGLAWSNLITNRFKINRHLQSEIREFEIVFAPDLPNDTCKFRVTKEGVIAAD